MLSSGNGFWVFSPTHCPIKAWIYLEMLRFPACAGFVSAWQKIQFQHRFQYPSFEGSAGEQVTGLAWRRRWQAGKETPDEEDLDDQPTSRPADQTNSRPAGHALGFSLQPVAAGCALLLGTAPLAQAQQATQAVTVTGIRRGIEAVISVKK